MAADSSMHEWVVIEAYRG